MKKLSQVVGGMLVMAVAGNASAALFSGPSFFSAGPTSGMGTVTNLLTLNDTGSGFYVTGQVHVLIPAGSSTGTLVTWDVDRPLDASFGSGIFTTTSTLTGFSLPPAGVVGTTGGTFSSYFTDLPNPFLAGSMSIEQVTLVNGVDLPLWTSLSVTSTSFSYVSGGTNYLHQHFYVDGQYVAGAGGTWIIDVPAITSISPVPEPASLLTLTLGACALLARKRRRA